jgi:hypothetical protein
MKVWRDKYKILFIILISSWVLIFPTYCLFYSLDKIDVFRNPHWENPVQEDLLSDLQKKGIGSGWNFCAIISPQGKESLELFPDLSLNPLSIEKVPVLRC